MRFKDSKMFEAFRNAVKSIINRAKAAKAKIKDTEKLEAQAETSSKEPKVTQTIEPVSQAKAKASNQTSNGNKRRTRKKVSKEN